MIRQCRFRLSVQQGEGENVRERHTVFNLYLTLERRRSDRNKTRREEKKKKITDKFQHSTFDQKRRVNLSLKISISNESDE